MESEAEKLLKDYFGGNQIVILDTVSTARVNLASQLVKLGAVRNKISLVSTVEEAEAEIKKHDAKVIFSDFTVGPKNGLDLLQNKAKTHYLF